MSKTALYRHFDKDGNLLYVGISCNPSNRFKQHKQQSDWAVKSERMETEWFDDRCDAFNAEKAAIINESPIYNIANSPRRTKIRQVKKQNIVTGFSPDRYLVMDRVTGEEFKGNLFDDEKKQSGIEKVCLDMLCKYMEISTSSRDRLLIYLLKIKDKNHFIHGTIREISEITKIGKSTVMSTFAMLQKKGLLKKIRAGCYQLDSNILF